MFVLISETNTMNILSLIAVLLFVASSRAFVVVPSSKAVPTSSRSSSSSTTSTALNILGRFRKKNKALVLNKPITIGTSIPEIDVEMLTTVDDDQIESVPIEASKVLGGEGKSILVGMPGAFTPTCTSEHLPGFIAASSQLRHLGVNTIAIVTTNDKYVNEEWARSAGLIGKTASEKSPITILADGDAELVTNLGLAEDMGFGVGLRAKRFALVCENGVVTKLLTDEGMDNCELTSAKNLIKVLTPEGQQVTEEMDQKTMALIGGGIAVALAAMFFMSGGDDHTATVAPAIKAVAPTMKAGSKEFSLLKQFGS
jgi:peroxiredoxin